MKIIDLLNKISNNEQPPKKIVWRNKVYIYDEDDYYTEENDDAIFDYHEITDILNEEVEILETTITMRELVDNSKINELIDKYEKWQTETKPDKIKKLGFENCTTPKSATENEAFLMTCINFASMKIDEIIDKINGE